MNLKDYYKISQHIKAQAPSLIHEYSLTNRNEPKKPKQIFIENNKKIDFVDFLEKPFLMVKDDFKKVVQLYNKDYNYNPVRLSKRGGEGMLYWYIDLPNINIEKQSIEEYSNLSFFKYKKGLATRSIYYIRLDLLESLLRRGIAGFQLQET